jgi:hypothetical protein
MEPELNAKANASRLNRFKCSFCTRAIMASPDSRHGESLFLIETRIINTVEGNLYVQAFSVLVAIRVKEQREHYLAFNNKCT